MRAVKIIALVLLCVFAVLCAAMGFLLATAPGLHFLVNQAKDHLPQLTQGTFSGSLLSLDAKEVVWEQPGLRFKGDFGWHIDFNKLLSVLRPKCPKHSAKRSVFISGRKSFRI